MDPVGAAAALALAVAPALGAEGLVRDVAAHLEGAEDLDVGEVLEGALGLTRRRAWARRCGPRASSCRSRAGCPATRQGRGR